MCISLSTASTKTFRYDTFREGHIYVFYAIDGCVNIGGQRISCLPLIIASSIDCHDRGLISLDIHGIGLCVITTTTQQ